jgi:hypothetical protein
MIQKTMDGRSLIQYRLTRHSSLQFWVLLFTAACLVGCQKASNELAIRSAHARYESWLLGQKPFLTNIPPSKIYGYEFTTVQDGPTTRPLVDYYLKCGDWDGLLNLSFVIDIDAQRGPTRLREQRITFIGLPARKIVMTKEGRRRTQYYGRTLKPSEMATVVARAIGGDDFDDLRTLAEQGDELVTSQFEDTDDWKNLRQ